MEEYVYYTKKLEEQVTAAYQWAEGQDLDPSVQISGWGNDGHRNGYHSEWVGSPEDVPAALRLLGVDWTNGPHIVVYSGKSGQPVYAPTTYTVPDLNIDRLRARVAWLNERAEKLGVAALVYRETGTLFRKLAGQDEFDDSVYLHHLVEIGGTSIVLEGGYRFVGTLEHADAGNVLRALPGETIPDSYRHAPAQCDHCQLERNRKDTYIVADAEGLFLQVGKTCLKDFTGHVDPQRLGAFAEYLAQFGEFVLDLEEETGKGGSAYYQPIQYLTWVAVAIRCYGWLSKSKAAEQPGQPTAWVAFDLLADAKGGKAYDKKTGLQVVTRDGRPVQVENEDRDLAKAALEWAGGLEETDNDYLWNVYVTAGQEAWGPRQFGLGASIIPAYQRSLEQQRLQEEAGPGEWIGKEKQRLDFVDLQCVRVIVVDGFYGTKYGCKFVDAAGNDLIWWKTTWPPLEEGRTYAGKATVKRHGEYNGRRQTELSRAAFEPTDTPEPITGQIGDVTFEYIAETAGKRQSVDVFIGKEKIGSAKEVDFNNWTDDEGGKHYGAAGNVAYNIAQIHLDSLL